MQWTYTSATGCCSDAPAAQRTALLAAVSAATPAQP